MTDLFADMRVVDIEVVDWPVDGIGCFLFRVGFCLECFGFLGLLPDLFVQGCFFADNRDGFQIFF
ncbi:hypothetical protein [Endozoicomonas sp. ALC066]|uniref:hypothetical protein n=1 Tax=Endozoicomonas sp. ALC066 TaxID=3403078 RepID=UPI003BB70634